MGRTPTCALARCNVTKPNGQRPVHCPVSMIYMLPPMRNMFGTIESSHIVKDPTPAIRTTAPPPLFFKWLAVARACAEKVKRAWHVDVRYAHAQNATAAFALAGRYFRVLSSYPLMLLIEKALRQDHARQHASSPARSADQNMSMMHNMIECFGRWKNPCIPPSELDNDPAL